MIDRIINEFIIICNCGVKFFWILGLSLFLCGIFIGGFKFLFKNDVIILFYGTFLGVLLCSVVFLIVNFSKSLSIWDFVNATKVSPFGAITLAILCKLSLIACESTNIQENPKGKTSLDTKNKSTQC